MRHKAQKDDKIYTKCCIMRLKEYEIIIFWHSSHLAINTPLLEIQLYDNKESFPATFLLKENKNKNCSIYLQ